MSYKELSEIWRNIEFIDAQKGTWIVITLLRERNEPTPFKEIKDTLLHNKESIISPTTLSEILKEILVKKKLVTREVLKDRGTLYSLTETGKKLAIKLKEIEEFLSSI